MYLVIINVNYEKLFQTGLALGNISGNCEACNIDLSWLYRTPSKLLWLDKIVVTDHLWNLLVSPKNLNIKQIVMLRVIKEILCTRLRNWFLKY